MSFNTIDDVKQQGLMKTVAIFGGSGGLGNKLTPYNYWKRNTMYFL